nr:pentatricopeptide repeat-containing protein At1g11290, chloroplastic-like [Tanacetum cinerariifolium]
SSNRSCPSIRSLWSPTCSFSWSLRKLMPTKMVKDYEDQDLVFYNDQKEPLLASMWEIKSKMEERGIRKIPGYSSVDLENEVHTFYSGSSVHYPYKEIYDFLETLIDNIKAVGYVPDNDLIHEVEDDLQEQVANCAKTHSEKLAIAFVLLNTSLSDSLDCNGFTLFMLYDLNHEP